MSDQSTERTNMFKPGDVLRYEDRRRPGDVNYRWCKEELAIVDDRGIALDTFWGGPGSTDRSLHSDELATARVIANLNDYTLHSEYGRMTTEAINAGMANWEDYSSDDRLWITRQHGCIQILYVRNGAQPDISTKLTNARERVREAESRLRSAEWSLQRAQEDLAKLEAQAVEHV